MSAGKKHEFAPQYYLLAGLRSLFFATAAFLALWFAGIINNLPWLPPLLTVLLYLRAIWRFRMDKDRLTVVVDGNSVTGPGATRWSPRVKIGRKQLDRPRMAQRTLIERLFGYRNIYAKDGNAITVDVWLIGPRAMDDIAKLLKLP